MDAMKKMLRKIKKTKKKSDFKDFVVTRDEVCKDAVPDPPRNLKIEVPERSELYRNFRFDNCEQSLNELESSRHHNNFNSFSSEQEESLKYSCSASPDSEAIPINSNNCRQRSVSSPQPETQNSDVESHFIQPTRFNSEGSRANVEDLPQFGSESSSESESDLRETDEIEESVNDLTNSISVTDEVSRNSKKVSDEKKISKKRKNNTFVINISNSKHFQIGSQKNVFLNGAQDNILPVPGLGNQIKNLHIEQNKRQNFTLQSNGLSKVTRTITDQEIAKVASHVDDSWIKDNLKDFGKNLGLQQSDIDNIERVAGENPKLIVFDMLKTLKEKEPNISVSFIAEVLTKSNQYRAIQQLVS